MFHEKLKTIIHLLDVWLSLPQDYAQLEQWMTSAHLIIDTFDICSELELSYLDRILEMYQEQWTKCIVQQAQHKTDIPLKETLDALLLEKQIEQRTPEWYQQMATIISASELGHLFGSVRERAKLVLSKTVPYPSRNQSLAVVSERMSAFDWGIRFEPVVKQIYEHKYGTIIKELGRLSHKVDPRCMASPDGLIYHCPKNERTGRLIEIKCPVTREIDGSIPKDYYAQMQMQLHVTGLSICDYVEAVFTSPYHQGISLREGPGLYNGYIALVQRADATYGQDFYYVYSPVNCDSEWTRNVPIAMNEEIVEIIPWTLHQWSEQQVRRSEEWWTALQPIIQTFWEDVEKAKRGEFTVPESSRPLKKAKTEQCMIVFTKCDEDGMVIDA